VGDLCNDRIVIVTGGARGIGRSEALAFASQGAKVVVSDLGVELDGSAGSVDVAASVASEIRARGGEATSIAEDVGDTAAAKRIVDCAIDTYGGLDVVVNNAGIIRDKMIFNMDERDFDAVIRVHLKGTWNLSRWAAIYWRDRIKQGTANDARIINTSSPSGLFGRVGQTNYVAAKAGIAAMTITLAAELGRYDVTANAISPVAQTRMTATLERPSETVRPEPSAGGIDLRSPDFVAPLVAWLGSSESRNISGQVFEVGAGLIGIAQGWRHGPAVAREESIWDPAELGAVVGDLMARATPPETS
jgi:NAD(P)-dependent dehydrogenase (short-subunit alcohol dehydrogenase family)